MGKCGKWVSQEAAFKLGYLDAMLLLDNKGVKFL